MGNLKEDLQSMATDCQSLRALAEVCSDNFKKCVIGINQKISVDNFGTTSRKDGAINNVAEASGVLSDMIDLYDNLFTVFNKQ